MKRPYYIHTPRNTYGESLVNEGYKNGVKYVIRSVHDTRTPIKQYIRIKWAKKAVKKMNDRHEIMLAIGQNI